MNLMHSSRLQRRLGILAVALLVAVAAVIVATNIGSRPRKAPGAAVSDPQPGAKKGKAGKQKNPAASPVDLAPGTAAAEPIVPVPPAAPPPVPPGPVKEFQGASDCSEDVTAKVNGFIASVADGSTVAFQAGACYRVDGTVSVVDRRNLTFEGRGATFAATSGAARDGKHWHFERGGGHTIRNLNVKGAHPRGGKSKEAYVADLSGQHGFDFQAVDGAILDHVSVRDVYGDFVYLGPDTKENGYTWTTKVVVTDSVFERNGRQAFAITGASDVRIERNVIRGVARSVFDIEPNSSEGGAQRVLLAANEISAWENALLPISGGGAVSDIDLRDNRISGEGARIFMKALGGRNDGRRARLSVTGNRSDKVMKISMVVAQDLDGLVVRDNYHPFDLNQREPAIKAFRTRGITVEGNDFPGATVTVRSDDRANEKADKIADEQGDQEKGPKPAAPR